MPSKSANKKSAAVKAQKRKKAQVKAERKERKVKRKKKRNAGDLGEDIGDEDDLVQTLEGLRTDLSVIDHLELIATVYKSTGRNGRKNIR